MLFASDGLLQIPSENEYVIKGVFMPQAILSPVLKHDSFASNNVPSNFMCPTLLQYLRKVIAIFESLIGISVIVDHPV